jgi:uncharacterized repeat protein (TIGR01451 family)
MSRLQIRSSYQMGFMFLVVMAAAITGWACTCGSGSDHISSSTSNHDTRAAPGVVERYHDFTTQDFTITTKDLDYLREWTQSNVASIGILLPTAPGASQPGTLSGDGNNIMVVYSIGVQHHSFTIPLSVDETMASELTTMFPPPTGAHWQVLVPTNYDWLSELPTQTATIENTFGSLYYTVDFHGADICIHCEVKLTGCSDAELAFSEQALLRAFGHNAFAAGDTLTCKTPVSTYIMPSDNATGDLLPGGPVIASFGFWGGAAYATTLTSDVVIPLTLNHTAATAQTFNLAAPVSEQGWAYHWENLTGNTITQLVVGPLVNPLWDTYEANLRLVGSGLPTCTRTQDRIQLSASLVSTPAIQADLTTFVQTLPDPAVCDVADVGITQTASQTAIAAGEWVTFTLTLTNYESTPVSVTVTDTLSSAAAVGSVTLPAVCTRNGTQITCQVVNLPGGSSLNLPIAVQVSEQYSGVLTNRAQAEPTNATDDRFYDNAADPVDVTITGGSLAIKLYLPLIKR